ncbi:MAG: AAA family ATPase [Deltaproteobacteria bacterium]|nr:AAA family ATPase [Deltaproteobacteria bacterium]MBW2068595.1 AAA family ATPase [Deltaproteobacteria bacterium]
MTEIERPKIRQTLEVLSHYLHGKNLALRLALTCFFARGHLLIEDLPGLGKTTLAIGIAKILGLEFGRIQCTNDLLPSDVTGLSVFDRQSSSFQFRPGPIFHNIVLVDEINRATPKTQSALLEAMGEKQVTVEGRTYPLPQPFFVIATQNPLESFGTFPLPESQMDRFMMKIKIGYPSREAEREILKGGSRRKELYSIDPLFTADEIMEIQNEITNGIHVSNRVLDYIQDIVDATRNSPLLTAGLSTRGALALLHTSRVDAYFANQDYVSPDNVKFVAPYVIPHRVLFRDEYITINREEAIISLIGEVPVPVF